VASANAKSLPLERGVDIRYETVRFRWHRFGPLFAAEVREAKGTSSQLFSLTVASR
jgi:hypothetical protein